MKVIGITGGVGAGKSQVINYVIDHWNVKAAKTDEVGHIVMSQGTECFDRIVDLFGEDICREDGSLDRGKIADLVFTDKKMLEKLNAIVHPAVKQYIIDEIEAERKNQTSIYLIESALLLDDHYDTICDEIWYVYANEETRRKRLMENRGYSNGKIENIFANQLSEEKFRESSDFVIDNSTTMENTVRQLEQRMQRIKENEII